MKLLRKGSRGKDIRELQEKLNNTGSRLKVDGVFWSQTDKAIRNFQRKNLLIPDGIVGEKTRVALEKHDASKSVNATKLVGTIAKLVGTGSIAAAVIAAKNSRAQLSYSPSLLKTSKNGLNHLYKTESLKNISNRLHWPGGGSGVTLGPGYDMKERSETEIVKAMLAISLDNKLATSISKAAGLEKQAAKTFAKNNKKLVKLNKQQEIKLLTNIVPTYEKLVKNLIKVDLTQHEFDALVSFAYNPGGRLATVCRFINQGEIAKAMNNIKKAITSGGKIMGGLIKRRDKEVNMYLYSDYGK